MAGFEEEAIGGFWYRFAGDPIVSERSPFQQIDIYRTPSFGHLLTLDGLVQTSEEDEFCYHEMLVHVPMLTVDVPERVLIIGGGDGGTLRHVLMHPSVRRAVMCEIDERVTELCRRHMPSIAGDAFEDPRAEVLFDDGIAYVRDGDETFDVIIVDSSDPIGPGEGLFTTAFYTDVARRLTAGGVVCVQSGSPIFQQDELHRAHQNMGAVLPEVRTFMAAVPTYPGTLWTYTIGGERVEVLAPEIAAARAAERGLRTRYWSPALQRGAFDLPQIAREVIAADGPPHTWGASPEERERRDAARS